MICLTLFWDTCRRGLVRFRRQPQYSQLYNLDPEDEATPATSRPRYSKGWKQHAALGFYGFLTVIGLYLAITYEQPADIRYRPILREALRKPRPQGYHNGDRVFIAAMFHNNERIIPYWSREIMKVIAYIGTENVFVSVVESHSGDKTAALLSEFDASLASRGIRRRIILGDTSVPRPESMETSPARIEFLAATRNLVLAPLRERGEYDRVLFSNDVFVEAESIIELLRTRDGDWDMVCGLDLSFWGLYDAWVARDRLGGIVSSLWPYFLEDAGMKAVMRDEPAPAFTCWNGITAIRADPFIQPSLRAGAVLSRSPSPALPSTHPAYPQPANITPFTTPALLFRQSGPDECFSSESFLLPYDLRRQFDLQNIYVNPRVITSYDWGFYVWYKYILRHWLVKWWIEKVENGAGMHLARMIIGNAENIWRWDGGECQPVCLIALFCCPTHRRLSPQWH
ncbi:glycosyltransferase family 69 protein [Fistulina hepatica ATCC 64428]|uniref:Glycosyltransferase family 69 protein n=1 Tax=Fistulina hepatica ATCC 64428 TaxID=1128425 RepID=A0A0D7AP40_9AGAR|nr:glycosyltransferase family 69 protein [Fistulina hepatica ATCC 64428]